MLRRLLIFLVLAYVLAAGYMYAMQEELLFHPKPLHAEHAAALKDLQVRVPRPGALLHGWQINPGSDTLVIFFGGNAEEVSHLADEFGSLEGVSTLLLNYRGYGLSSGEPGEDALVGDALFVLDQLPHLVGYRPRRVILAGRSLGSGIAVRVAARREVDGLILVTPYDSIRALSQDRYPWLPIDLLLRHPFDAAAAAPGVSVPTHILLAETDQVIPHAHAQALAAALPAPPQSHTISGTDHNDIMDNPAFWRTLRRILDTIPTT